MPLRILIAEDESVSRQVLMKHLSPLGQVDLALDGHQAVEAVFASLRAGQGYDLICLDILMPNLDGRAALTAIRDLEEQNGLPLGHGAKIVMTTALRDAGSILGSFGQACDAYLAKPVTKEGLFKQLKALGLVAR
ncbi:MAG: response regulator [Desulfarculus sp.]|nr:response regulator [Desulfarculus sp.]